MQTPWGHSATQFFFQLTPDVILNAFERATGMRSTGRLLQLNSMENRVFEIEIDIDDDRLSRNSSERFRVIKFYRPGRWSKGQILDEHQFLLDLVEAEIPAVAPMLFQDGSTLGEVPDGPIFFAAFPKVGGRVPDELNSLQRQQIGRLLGRLHTVGRKRLSRERVSLTPEVYGLSNLRYLNDLRAIPENWKGPYENLVNEICQKCHTLFANIPVQRLHGDCHLGNLIEGQQGFFWVDFDDMVVGPVVQDLWLLIPDRGEDAREAWEDLLLGYEMMAPFDRGQLKLVEGLRALRMIHFAAWIGRRWQDPAFQRAFPDWGTDRYWQEQVADLREQKDWLDGTIQ